MEKTKNFIMSVFNDIIKYAKANKKITYILLAFFIIFIVLVFLLFESRNNKNLNSNLSNLGFTLDVNGTLYYSNVFGI